MAVFDSLLPTVQPGTYKGVFNPISYTFAFSGIDTATFDSTSDGGLATVKVSNTMAALFNVGDLIIMGGGVMSEYAGIRTVISKTAISGGVTRVTFDTVYSGVSPSGKLIPYSKLNFDIWVGFTGAGSSRLSWARRDQITVSPNIDGLNYHFEVQVFLKKWFDLLAPIIGNDYNISLKYAVVGQGVTPNYAEAKSAYYGFKDPTLGEIEDRLPLGLFPINYVDKNLKPVPVISSIVDDAVVGNVFNFLNPSFNSGLTNWTQEEQGDFVNPFTDDLWITDTGRVRVTVSEAGTIATKILTQTISFPDIDSATLSVEYSLTDYTTGTINLQAIVKFTDDTYVIVFFSIPSADTAGSTVVQPLTKAYIQSLYPSKTLADIESIGFYFVGNLQNVEFAFNQLDCTFSSVSSGDRSVKNLLSSDITSVITSPTYYFEALVGSLYEITFQHTSNISSLNVTPSLPSWITIETSPANQIKLRIYTSVLVDGDYSSTDYGNDYDSASINNIAGCYEFVFKDGTTTIWDLAFCIGPVAAIEKVCPDDVVNIAFLNQSGGFNSVALECQYINGREFNSESLFKTSTKQLKRSRFDDVYDTITLSASSVSRRTLELIKEMRSSISCFMWNSQTLAFDIPIVIDRANIQTVGNTFNQAQSRVSMTIRKSQEVLTQTQ